MPDIKTNRPFEERFLDGFDRSKLREEVQKVKPKRLSGLRKKYASWALGGALALGSLGVPLKMATATHTTASNPQPPQNQPPQNEPPQQDAIANDLATTKQIAEQVTGGGQGA